MSKRVPVKFQSNETVGIAEVRGDGYSITFIDTEAGRAAKAIMFGEDDLGHLSIVLDPSVPTEWNDNAYTVVGEPATLINNMVKRSFPDVFVKSEYQDHCPKDEDGIHFFRGRFCIYCNCTDPLIDNVFEE
jgi:hypothetical protein